MDFLGHHVSTAGVPPLSSHIQAITDYPQPTSIKDLQRFLGVINFYRRFVPHAAAVLHPLNDALIGSPKLLSWTPAMSHSFQQAQTALSHATLLAHLHPTAPLALATDASDSHIGSVLQQNISHHWQPLSFFSAKLSPTQQCYSTLDRELQAACSAVLHFQPYLEGHPFLLLTNHKSLVAAFNHLSPPKSARQQWQLAFLSEFPLTIQHTSGQSNTVEDALSHPSFPSPQPICPLFPLFRLTYNI